MDNTIKLTPNQVEQIRQELQTLGNKVQSVLNRLTKIETYLYEDSQTNTPGVIAKQRDHEKRITKLENESMQQKKIWASLGLIAGVVGTAIFEFIRYLFTNHKT